MNELSESVRQLPDTLADLSKFVLVGREKLNAVRAEIRAIEKVQLAAEVHEQKLEEAQEIAEAVLDAETKLGELTSKMEQTKGARTDIKPTDSGVPKSKAQQLEEIGITEKQKQRFETLASHPEVVEQAKADARANGRIVTRADVLNRIAPPQSHQQTLRAVEKQVRAEHQAFKEKKKDSVVSFQDIEKDRKNEQFIINRTDCDLKRVIGAVGDINFLNVEDIDALVKSLDKEQKEWYIRNLRKAVNTLIHIMKKMEVSDPQIPV